MDHPKLTQLPEHLRDTVEFMEAIPVGLAVADFHGEILYVNPRGLQALGYDDHELVGAPLDKLYRSSIRSEEFRAILEATLQGGWSGEVTGYRRDNSPIPLFLETRVLRDHDGSPVAFVAVARDISDERSLQQRLSVEAQLGTLGLIAKTVAHEVRNHLAAIKMSLYMLEKRRDPPQGDEALHFHIASHEIRRIEQFVRQIESYANPPATKFEPSSLLEVIDRGLEEARPALLTNTASLQRQFPDRSPTLDLDREQFADAVCQVVTNAAEARERGEIHVAVKRVPGSDGGCSWRIEFRDNGPGIPPHLHDRIFEPFVTTANHRMGLGLTNVRRILELHGGKVEVQETGGRGTTMVLTLPETRETP